MGVSDFNNSLKLGFDPGSETYPQWMLQRVLDAYNSSSESDKELTFELFTKLGASALFDLDVKERLARKNYQLVQENS